VLPAGEHPCVPRSAVRLPPIRLLYEGLGTAAAESSDSMLPQPLAGGGHASCARSADAGRSPRPRRVTAAGSRRGRQRSSRPTSGDAGRSARPGFRALVEVGRHLAAMVGDGVELGDAPMYAGCNDLGNRGACWPRWHASMYAGSCSRPRWFVYGEGLLLLRRRTGQTAASPRPRADMPQGPIRPACSNAAEPLRAGVVTEDRPSSTRGTGMPRPRPPSEYLASAWARAAGRQCRRPATYHNGGGVFLTAPGMPRRTPRTPVSPAIFRRSWPQETRADGVRGRRDSGGISSMCASVAAAERGPPWSGPGPLCREPAARSTSPGDASHHRGVGRRVAEAVGGPATRGHRTVTGSADVRHVTASNRRLREELGWAPAVDFADGLRSSPGPTVMSPREALAGRVWLTAFLRPAYVPLTTHRR